MKLLVSDPKLAVCSFLLVLACQDDMVFFTLEIVFLFSFARLLRLAIEIESNCGLEKWVQSHLLRKIVGPEHIKLSK